MSTIPDSPPAVPVTIFHNPACGTSRNTLALIRNAGIELVIIEYLKTPPDRATLEERVSDESGQRISGQDSSTRP